MSASIEISRRCGRACQTGIENLAITTTRLAYSRAEAAEALGVSVDFFDEHTATSPGGLSSAALVDAIARRVVELLRDADDADAGLLSASQVATRFGVSRDWVYRHAANLGVHRLGEGDRPRLRFDPDRVREHLDACSARSQPVDPASPGVKPRSRPRRTPAPVTEVELLPVRGSDDTD